MGGAGGSYWYKLKSTIERNNVVQGSPPPPQHHKKRTHNAHLQVVVVRGGGRGDQPLGPHVRHKRVQQPVGWGE